MKFAYCSACYKFMATWFFGGFRCQLIQNTHTVKPPKYKHNQREIQSFRERDSQTAVILKIQQKIERLILSFLYTIVILTEEKGPRLRGKISKMLTLKTEVQRALPYAVGPLLWVGG
jgi:hypothetical protein